MRHHNFFRIAFVYLKPLKINQPKIFGSKILMSNTNDFNVNYCLIYGLFYMVLKAWLAGKFN